MYLSCYFIKSQILRNVHTVAILWPTIYHFHNYFHKYFKLLRYLVSWGRYVPDTFINTKQIESR